MNFAFSEEQENLREAVRRFLADKSPSSEVRRVMATTEGYDLGVWRQMADELGLQSLAIPEEHGGAGFTFVELTIVLEEMGGALLCAPFLSSVVLAANALLASGDEEASARWLPGIVSGETIATLAIAEDTGKWDLDAVRLAATSAHRGRRSGSDRGPDASVLHGHKGYVLDGCVATLLLVVARMEEGLGLFALRGDASGILRTPLSTMDQTRKQARVELAGASAQLVGCAGQAGPGITKTLQLAAVALAAEQVGGTQRCLDSTASTARSSTPRRASSSAGRSAAFRRSSTSVLTCCSRWSPRAPLRATPDGLLLETPTSFRSPRASPNRIARRPISTPQPRTSTSTGGSGTPGSTTRTSTRNEPNRLSFSSAIPRTTASCSLGTSASDR
jgi:alkylation response protein AidB-like acyl-CoA dehydrogenase